MRYDYVTYQRNMMYAVHTCVCIMITIGFYLEFIFVKFILLKNSHQECWYQNFAVWK